MISQHLPRTADVVVVGAGVVGAACAAALTGSGLDVCVVDRLGPAAGASSAGEGNLLVSDKLPGPELALALRSVALWREFAQRCELPFEFEAKGGLVVAGSASASDALRETVTAQRSAGVHADLVTAAELGQYEPMLAAGLLSGACYPQDAQVQPMLAVRALLHVAVRRGATVVGGCEVIGARRDASGSLRAVETSRGTVAAPRVVVAAGAFSAEAAHRLGAAVRVQPRRGHVVVTEALPRLVRHKVYAAEYVGDIGSDDAGLRSSPVVEGTESGPILLGSSRELAGFDRRLDLRVVSQITRRAVALFPFLRDVHVTRSYLGFRPATTDHLPVIGEQREAPGTWFATGHEGAGVGLAMGSAEVLRDLMLGAPPILDPAAFSASRPAVRREVDHAG